MELCFARLILIASFSWCLLHCNPEIVNVPVCLMDNICAEVPQDLVSNLTDEIVILFYTGKTTEEYITLSLNNITDIQKHPAYDTSKTTILYLHGFTENPRKRSVQTVVSALLTRGGRNVVVVDWSSASGPPYRQAAALAPVAGIRVARGLDALLRAGTPPDRLHVVGHSLGGQVAAHVGRNMRAGRLHRITALDPARPLFEGASAGGPGLRRGDAGVVAVLHTDGGAYGARAPLGSHDFFPNGGARPQPTCPHSPAPAASNAAFGVIPALPSTDTPNKTIEQDFCSHSKSWRYFAASVLNETLYPATLCFNWYQFQLGMCPAFSSKVFMGIAEPMGPPGSYFLYARDDYLENFTTL